MPVPAERVGRLIVAPRLPAAGGGCCGVCAGVVA